MSEGERLTAEKEDRVRVRIASDSLHYATTDEIKADYTLLLTEIDQLRAELAAATSFKAVSIARIAGLEAELAAAKNEWQQDANTWGAKLDLTEKELAEAKEKELAELKDQLADSQTMRLAWRLKAQKHEAELAAKDKELAQLRSELNEARKTPSLRTS